MTVIFLVLSFLHSLLLLYIFKAVRILVIVTHYPQLSAAYSLSRSGYLKHLYYRKNKIVYFVMPLVTNFLIIAWHF